MKVVNIHHYPGVRLKDLPPGHKYIGRGSGLGNPYSHLSGSSAVHLVATRDEAVALYEPHARANLMDQIADLEPDTVLVCFCKPKSCHGDIIIKLWEEINGDDVH